MVKDTTLYDKLGISTNASIEEINKAYKKLAIRLHPDKNLNDEKASEKFQEISNAKDILTDPEKKKLYDQFGMDAINGDGGQNPDEMFTNMFGNGFPFNNHFNRQQEKENITIEQEVSLEQIYNEETIQIQFKQKHLCNNCNGNGTKDGLSSQCKICNGNGIVIQIIKMGPITQQIQTLCPECKGSCKNVSNNNKCSSCNGECYKLKEVRINVPLKNGLTNGQQIQLPGHGHHLKEGNTDLIIILKEKKHNIFSRIGANLIIDIELTLYQALFGFDIVVEHLDKRKLLLSNNKETNYNTTRKIINEGMKNLNNNTKGNLIIKFTIKLPMCDSIDEDIVKKLKSLLKSINQESNNEIINNKNEYINTLMTEYKENEKQQEQEQEQQQQLPHQCVHQ